ncbi:hypothetical protein JOL79_20040 [Microbispora sp. RL4-1S]|uniref:Endonuclease/exonuclease/phosphatase domain-containing protein n=1 Tax=Microbispora oryzae TaxID=2806554 RepID=A0A940WJH2_9ACTN|nr:endonuclease/exonuclease/phosphatase family protein [Microbispora oryzae]MBP2706103.1 hypothetical protein [Microbispora oryzae]
MPFDEHDTPAILGQLDGRAFPQQLSAIQADDDGTTAHQMGRGAMAVRVTEPDGRTIDLIVAHLKSKLLSFPPGPTGRPRFQPRDEGERARVAAYALYRRTAEAVTVRALADELLGGQGEARQVMVTGDFNDEPEAATTQILLGPPGSELGTPGADQPDRGDKARLWNLAPRIPAAERFSRVFHGRGELIDHLLVSHALLARAVEVHTLRPEDAVGPHDGLPSMAGQDRAAGPGAHACFVTTWVTYEGWRCLGLGTMSHTNGDGEGLSERERWREAAHCHVDALITRRAGSISPCLGWR